MKQQVVVLAVMVALLAGVRPASASIVFSDDEFADANWDLTPIAHGTGSTSATHQAAGGNLDAFRRVVTNVGPAGSAVDAAQILGFHKTSRPSMTPACLGRSRRWTIRKMPAC